MNQFKDSIVCHFTARGLWSHHSQFQIHVSTTEIYPTFSDIPKTSFPSKSPLQIHASTILYLHRTRQNKMDKTYGMFLYDRRYCGEGRAWSRPGTVVKHKKKERKSWWIASDVTPGSSCLQLFRGVARVYYGGQSHDVDTSLDNTWISLLPELSFFYGQMSIQETFWSTAIA